MILPSLSYHTFFIFVIILFQREETNEEAIK